MEKYKKRGNHPRHPRCPECGRALYKARTPGVTVVKSMAWAWCRNSACKLNGVDQSKPVMAVESTSIASDSSVLKAKVQSEPEAITRARERIRAVLKAAIHSDKDRTVSRSTMGLVLALASQETGNHTAANALIDEHELTKLGIKKHT